MIALNNVPYIMITFQFKWKTREIVHVQAVKYYDQFMGQYHFAWHE